MPLSPETKHAVKRAIRETKDQLVSESKRLQEARKRSNAQSEEVKRISKIVDEIKLRIKNMKTDIGEVI